MLRTHRMKHWVQEVDGSGVTKSMIQEEERRRGVMCPQASHAQADIRWKDLTQIQCRAWHSCHLFPTFFFLVVCVGQSSVISTCHPKARRLFYAWALLVCSFLSVFFLGCLFGSMSNSYGLLLWRISNLFIYLSIVEDSPTRWLCGSNKPSNIIRELITCRCRWLLRVDSTILIVACNFPSTLQHHVFKSKCCMNARLYDCICISVSMCLCIKVLII
jgi:hypothetical protein